MSAFTVGVSAIEAMRFAGLKVALVLGVDAAFDAAVVVGVLNDNRASRLVVSVLLTVGARHFVRFVCVWW